MGLDYKSLSERVKEHLESDEGKEWMRQLDLKHKLEDNRLKKVNDFLSEEGKLESVLKRLIDEHTSEYCEKWYKRGYEPNPTHKMQLLFDCATKFGNKVEDCFVYEEISFSTNVVEFKNLYFCITHGQGCLYSIYNIDTKELLFRF